MKSAEVRRASCSERAGPWPKVWKARAVSMLIKDLATSAESVCKGKDDVIVIQGRFWKHSD